MSVLKNVPLGASSGGSIPSQYWRYETEASGAVSGRWLGIEN